MGYDATLTLKKPIGQSKFDDLSSMLGIKKVNTNNYYYIDEKDYEMHQAVGIYFEKEGLKISKIFLRLQIWANYYEKQNFNRLLRIFHTHFGGEYITDYGKNKPLVLSGYLKISKAEAGCYYAYDDIIEHISKLRYYLNNIQELVNEKDIVKMLNVITPSIFSSHFAEVYMVTLIENYFRDIFVALLKYSPNKEVLLNNTKLHGEDLVDVSLGKYSLEKAYALSKNFQNIRKICDSFNELDKNIKLETFLKDKLYLKKLDEIMETRHRLIHRNIYNSNKDKAQAIKDLELLKKIFYDFNLHLCKIYKWDKLNYKT